MSFSWLSSTDDRLWGHFRGAKLLWALQKDERFAAVDIQCIEGHVAIAASKGSLLLVLDAAPDTYQLGDDAMEAALSAIKAGKANNEAATICAEACPAFVLQQKEKEAPIVRTFFEYTPDGSRLRLFALHQGGKVQAWCWFGTSSELYKWRWMGEAAVSEGGSVLLRDARMHVPGSMMVWWETDAEEAEGVATGKEELQRKQRLRLRKISNTKRQLKERLCYQRVNFEVDDSVPDGSKDRVVVERLVHGKGDDRPQIVCGYDNIRQIEATDTRLWILSDGCLASWLYGATSVQEVKWEEGSAESHMGVQCVTETVVVGTKSAGRRESLLTLDRILTGERASAETGDSAPEKAVDRQEGGEAGDVVRHVNRKRTSIGGVAAMAVNTASQDLVLLEPTGRILVCKNTGGLAGEVQVFLLCQLRGEKDWAAVRALISHRHILILLWEGQYAVCDPKTGVVVFEDSLPGEAAASSQWRSNFDVGLWSGRHMWRLLLPEATEYLHRLEALLEELPLGQRPVNYLATLSQCLGMVHTSTHFSLRELRRLCVPEDAEEVEAPAMPAGSRRQSTFVSTQSISPQIMQKQQEIARELLAHLQNPALVVALLGSIKSHKQFLDTEVATFLDRYSGLEGKDGRLAETWRFLLHTPLNMTIVPLLEEYRKLSLQQAGMSIGSVREFPKLNEKRRPSVIDLLKRGETSWSSLREEELVDLAFDEPEDLLEQLEADLELDDSVLDEDSERCLPATHALLKAEGNGGGFESKRSEPTLLFDTMCQLYFAAKPASLVPFAELLQRSQSSGPRLGGGQTRTWLFQAATVLPDVSSPGFTFHDGSDKQRIEAVLLLYGQLGMRGHAMRMLLALYLQHGDECVDVDHWGLVEGLLRQTAREAALLMDECASSAKLLEHDEVFHIALTHCLEHGDVAHCCRVLQHVPARLQPLDLLETLANYLRPDTSVRLDVLRSLSLADPAEPEHAPAACPILLPAAGEEVAFTVGCFSEQLVAMFQWEK